ncbi:MAG: hypothetical protein AAGK32_12105, partial [Actinomycetota bacterium]
QAAAREQVDLEHLQTAVGRPVRSPAGQLRVEVVRVGADEDGEDFDEDLGDEEEGDGDEPGETSHEDGEHDGHDD